MIMCVRFCQKPRRFAEIPRPIGPKRIEESTLVRIQTSILQTVLQFKNEDRAWCSRSGLQGPADNVLNGTVCPVIQMYEVSFSIGMQDDSGLRALHLAAEQGQVQSWRLQFAGCKYCCRNPRTCQHLLLTQSAVKHLFAGC